MFGLEHLFRSSQRRSAIREGRHDFEARSALPARDLIPSLAIMLGFWLAVTLLLMLRKDVVPYRVGDYVPHDIVARVDFSFVDEALHDQQVKVARESAPRAYRQVPGDIWAKVQDYLLALPDTVHDRAPEELDSPLRDILDSGAITELEQDRVGPDRQQYNSDVRQFIDYARKHLVAEDEPLVILKQGDRDEETQLAAKFPTQERKAVLLPPPADLQNPQSSSGEPRTIDVANVYGTNLPESLEARLDEAAGGFGLGLGSKVARITFAQLAANPNFQYDDQATHELQNQAEDAVGKSAAVEFFSRSAKIISGGSTLSDRDHQILVWENRAYYDSLTGDSYKIWQYRLGLALVAGILTFILAGYVARYQPRCIHNHARALAMGGLLLAMLLLTEVAGIGNSSLYIRHCPYPGGGSDLDHLLRSAICPRHRDDTGRHRHRRPQPGPGVFPGFVGRRALRLLPPG